MSYLRDVLEEMKTSGDVHTKIQMKKSMQTEN